MIKNTLKEKLYNNIPQFGTFISTNSPDVAEICALAGFDFVVIDMEHGYMNHTDITHLMRAASSAGAMPIVRVTSNDETKILRTLDCGAMGIHIPQINTPEQAKAAINYSKYAPMGNRGVAFHRANNYGLSDLITYMEEANKETMIIFHCESVEALENIDEIVSTPGLDCIMFGPYDMSMSMGMPGQVKTPEMEEAISKMLAACKKHGKIPGIFTSTAEDAKRRVKQGFLYMPVAMDCQIISRSYSQLIKDLR